MAEHDLKAWPDFWDATERGEKTFEIRKNDRGYQKGDVLLLRKWDPEQRLFMPPNARTRADRVEDSQNAATLRCEVLYVLNSNIMAPGFVVMSIRKLNDKR